MSTLSNKTREIIDYFLNRIWKTLILVSAGLLFALTLGTLIDNNLISSLKQTISPSLQVLFAALIGFIAPGPRYILYPLLATLQDLGIGTGIIIALISGHVLIEPSTFFIESGFFGIRFPVKRFISALIVTYLAGFITTLLIN